MLQCSESESERRTSILSRAFAALGAKRAGEINRIALNFRDKQDFPLAQSLLEQAGTRRYTSRAVDRGGGAHGAFG